MDRYPNKYVIGLTGNIATGKSVVRTMLQHLGAYPIDADALSRQAMTSKGPAFKPVVETFGQFIVGQDGEINRQLLGQMVFSNPEALKKLEDITHPIIRQAVNALIGRAKQQVIVIEAIKLLEGEMADWCDAIWVTNASRKSQYRRLVLKRKMSEADAKQRILAQAPQQEKIARADVVIENDGSPEETWKQVQQQWKAIADRLSSGDSAPAATSTQSSAAPARPQQATAQKQTQTLSIDGLKVRRGTPNNAQDIADFINAYGNAHEEVTKIDVMMNFGEKSYLLAQTDSDVVGLMGWTVENLVTRMDEVYVKPGAPEGTTVHAIIVAVEEASKELQSEVGFAFLPQTASAEIVGAFTNDGYEATELSQIKVPVWREAVAEKVTDGNVQVLWKQLRKDRVLQPI